jgi:clorobiocin/coumermycin A biosynthesis protein CloN7/CouN7
MKRTMSLSSNHRLDVPGASLYYEVQGSGPLLMLIGHPMGTSGFAAIAPLLAEFYTVVTYDPRGFARSTIDDPDQDADPDVVADDVRRVLEAVGQGSAYVFGSSGGAVTGLALVAQRPELVDVLVAHEPPVGLLLEEADDARAGMHEIYDTYCDMGIGAARGKFSAFTGLAIEPSEEDDDLQPPSAEEVADAERFFGHGLLPIALYEPDIPSLRAASSRIVVAGGTTSTGEFPQRTAFALAKRLGTPLLDCPGGHVGFISHPREFADALRACLA